MINVVTYACCLLVLLIGHEAIGSSSISPSEEVQKNFQQLMETSSCPGCNLAGAVLVRIDLSGANLEGANLAGAKLFLADLSGANLHNANLQGAALGGADLADADLRGANLTGAIMEGAYLVGAQFDGSVITRKSHVEDGEPATGEVVYVEDESHSKNLPFTNKPFVTDAPSSEKIAVAEPVIEKNPIVKVGKPPGQQVEDVGVEDQKAPLSQGEPARIKKQAPMSKSSKKIVMIADAVVPEETVEQKSSGEARDNTSAEMNRVAAKVSTMEDSAPVEEVAMVEPASTPISAQQEEPAKVVAIHQDIPEQEKPVVPTEPVPEETTPVVETQGLVVTDENVEAQPEEAVVQEMPEVEVVAESEQVVVLDEDAVVAEMVPAKEVVLAPVEVATEQNLSSDPPVQEESVPVVEQTPVVEKTKQVMPGSDIPEPVQEEIMQMEQEAQEAVVETEPEDPPVQDEEETEEDELPVSGERDKELLVEKLLDDNRCVACDLSGVDLSGRHLDEADLERANLRGADLSDTDLSEANLKGADLSNANLREADLREADLYRANLSGADLTGARFEEAMLDMVYSTGAIGVDFKGAITD